MSFALLHRIDQSLFVLVVHILKQYRMTNKALNQEFSFVGFRDDFQFDNLFFVKRTKDFFGNSHSASGFALGFLFL